MSDPLIQCDESRPACQRCHRMNIPCPGYDAFRDETQAVKRKAGHSASHVQKRSQNRHKPTGWTALEWHANRMYPELSENPEQEALCFMLSCFIPQVPGYFTDGLPVSYARTDASSVLALATQASSLGFLSLHPRCTQYRLLAVEKYSAALRMANSCIINQAASDPQELLMGLLMLGMFEHSRSLALEPTERSSHIIGTMAVLNTLTFEGPVTDLLSTLVKQARAQLIYEAIKEMNPGLLKQYLPRTEHFLDDNSRLPSQEINTFSDLAELIVGLPETLSRAKALSSDSTCRLSTTELASLLNDTMQQDLLYQNWEHAPSDHSYKIYCYQGANDEPLQEEYPAKVVYYDTPPYASHCNAWRLVRIRTLEVVIQCCQALESCYGEDRSLERVQAENTILRLFEEICESVPFYLGWNRPIKMANMRFPKGSDEARPFNFSDVELIAHWSQMTEILWSAAAPSPYVPEGRRKWLEGYLARFSGHQGSRFNISYLRHGQPVM